MAQLYSLLILVTITATPTGILRLYDRFDLLAVAELGDAGRALCRRAGCLSGMDAGFSAYLLIWFATGVAPTAHPGCPGLGRAQTPGSDRRHGSVAQGGRGGPPGDLALRLGDQPQHLARPGHEAHRYADRRLGARTGRRRPLQNRARVCQRFGRRPIVLLRQTVYPELAKLLAQQRHRRACARSCCAAAWLPVSAWRRFWRSSIALRSVTWLIQLDRSAGPTKPPIWVMILLVVARVIHVFPFALGPALTAMGAPGHVAERSRSSPTPWFSFRH